MPAIFISHSSRDQKIADEVTAAIRRLGFEEVFLDFDKDTGIGAGADWEKTLYENLSRCHAIILLLTPNWLTSTWCRIELSHARALGKVILPIISEPLGQGFVLPEIQAVDLVDWNADGLARIEQRLQAITNELARGFRLDPNRPPYPGIHAFEAEDAAIYFGRDDETRAVIEKLNARRTKGGSRFLLVIGASGAGKSSLLKAGVLPQLARRRDQWLLLPVMRPEKTPLEALAKALAQRLDRENDWRALYDDLRDPNAAGRIAQIIQDLRVGESRAATILLPIDQFEELFTVAEPDERASLLTLLATILEPALGLPLMVIATGRADVLQGLLETSALAPLMDTTPLLPMPLDRVPQLVRGPAAVASLVVEPGLPEGIMRDVENPEALPLLAYTLHLLHERSQDKRLTLDAYRALGDGDLNPVQNAVRLGADEAIARLKPTEQEMAALRDAFIPHLVRLRLDDKRHVRQPAPLAALPREAERLIHALIEARLLASRTSDRGVPVVEVVHEALFSAWPTLKGWLDDEQDFLADIERLKGAQETWMQAAGAQKPQALLQGLLLSRARDWLIKYPQRFASLGMKPLRAFVADSAAADDAERARSQRLRRRVFQGMAAAILVLTAAAAFAGWQYFEADKARREAETQRGIAQLQTDIAFQQEEEAQRARQGSETQRDLAQRNFEIAKQAADDVVFNLAQDLRNVAGMRVDSVRRILDTARALMDRLAQAAPDDLDLQRSRVAMLNAFVSTYLPLGDYTRAATAADEGLAIMRKVASANPDNAGWQRDVGVSLNYVGNVRRTAGDRAGALAAYEEYLATARRLSATDPGNVEWQQDVSIGLSKVGDSRRDGGDDDGALAAYQESLTIRRKLAAADPGDAEQRRALGVGLNKIGDVRLAAGDRAGAFASHEESLAIARKLAAAYPGNALWQRDLSISLANIGRGRLTAGERAGALAAYEESLSIARKLADADPDNAGKQIDLFISLYEVGTVTDSAKGREFMTTALRMAEGLAQEDKLPADMRAWPQTIRRELAKLPLNRAKPR